MSATVEKSPVAPRFTYAPLLQRARRALRGGLAAALVATAAVGAAGCSSAAPAATAAAHRGMSGTLEVALDEVELDAKQRAETRAVLDDVKAKLAPVRAGRQQVAAAIADRIAAGTLARADTDSAVAAVLKGDEAAVPVLQDAANRLHGMLDADQREDLLDAVRSSWRDSWRGEGGPKAQLRQLAEELDLTEDQRDAIKEKARAEIKRELPAMRAKMASARDRMKSAAKAFVSDKFDATTLDLGADGLAMHKGILEVSLHVVEASLPTLTPAQRAKLAEHVRTRFAAMN